MSELKFANTKEAIQYLADLTGNKIIVGSSVFDSEADLFDVYPSMLESPQNIDIFVWDFSDSFDSSGESGHYSLPDRIKDKEGRDNVQIVEEGVRGYYVKDKKKPKVIFYQYVKNGHITTPSGSMVRSVLSKLKAPKDTETILIKGHYEMTA